jgi:hypothetical protein
MKRLYFLFLAFCILGSIAFSQYDSTVYANIHIKLLTITNIDNTGWRNDSTIFTFGYINDADTMIYIANSDPHFLVILPNGALYSQSLIDLQYFYPGIHNALYGPEFPTDSGKTIWIKFPSNASFSVLNKVKFKVGSDTVVIDKNSVPREMPVEMTSFTAAVQGTDAVLLWSTATEVNNNGFEIERRAEGSSSWAKIGFVSGAGTSNSPKSYSFQDAKLTPGVYVYRIKQIDNDGAFKYSAGTQVDVGVSNALKLGGNYPNPFNPTTNIQFSVPENGYASLKVYNMLGQEVATLFSGMATAGHYIPATFNASRLASGIYFARLQYNGKSLVQRMLMTK